jgi:AAHS family benzoate transporter-like MFS transporter
MKLPLVQNFLAIAMAAVIGGVAVALIRHKSSASSLSHDASAVGQRP